MRGNELSLEQRGKIISLHQKGLGYIKIFQNSKFMVPATQRIIQKWISTGSVANKRRTGQIQSQHGVSISNQTVRNLIKEKGYKGAVARKKPFISKRNNLSGFISCKVGESLKPNCLRKTIKHGGGSIMVWGSMSTNGVGKLHFIDGIMNKDVYQSILQKNLLPSVRKLRIRGTVSFNRTTIPKVPPKPPRNEAWEYLDPDFTKKLVDSMPRRIQAVIEAMGGPTRY
ncbi:Transposable element Tcb2 transposase [Folsomia candida]|uniref:Transposable element Tcb2 transposase n=1 Tax=Folsomia candida TaxID=158441 RepID=A0A226DPC1_FOLCA|nr:Transposable element Tcb2 transposase [Folsomia candida]OXA46684.1 Transposable element Tcb2 transposase [Folsomia candida]